VEATTNVVDFMALLRKSLEEGKRSAPSAKRKAKRRTSRAKSTKRKAS
jgi:DNA end-binding protein Ku